jgi:hypothetical protein
MLNNDVHSAIVAAGHNAALIAVHEGVQQHITRLQNLSGALEAFTEDSFAEHEAFEDWFVTPHGLDLAPTADLYDFAFTRVQTLEAFRAGAFGVILSGRLGGRPFKGRGARD